MVNWFKKTRRGNSTTTMSSKGTTFSNSFGSKAMRSHHYYQAWWKNL